MSHSCDDSVRQDPRSESMPDSQLEVDRMSPTVRIGPRSDSRAEGSELRPRLRPDPTDPLPGLGISAKPSSRTPNRTPNRPSTPLVVSTSLLRRGQHVGDYEILEE